MQMSPRPRAKSMKQAIVLEIRGGARAPSCGPVLNASGATSGGSGTTCAIRTGGAIVSPTGSGCHKWANPAKAQGSDVVLPVWSPLGAPSECDASAPVPSEAQMTKWKLSSAALPKSGMNPTGSSARTTTHSSSQRAIVARHPPNRADVAAVVMDHVSADLPILSTKRSTCG